MKISGIVLKFIKCNYRCIYCFERKSLHDTMMRSSKYFTLDDWYRVLNQAKSSGVSHVRISGGEPFLYKDIVPLTEYINSLGFQRLRLFTNGVFMDAVKMDQILKLPVLCDMFVSHADFSFDSFSAHTGCRNIQTYRRRTKNTLYTCRKALTTEVKVLNAVVLTRQRLMNLPYILQMSKAFGFYGVVIEILEGLKTDRLTDQDLKLFERKVVPSLGKYREIVVDCLLPRLRESANGKPEVCDDLGNMVLAFCNGDVHGCCIAEYSHEKECVVGNLHVQSLQDILTGDRMKLWLQTRSKYCHMCTSDFDLWIKL